MKFITPVLISLSILCLLVDSISFSLMGKPCSLTLVALAIVMLITDRTDLFLFASCLLSLDSFLEYNSMALPLVYILPLFVTHWSIQSHVYVSVWYVFLMSMAALVCNIGIAHFVLLGMRLETGYTFTLIFGNILVALVFFLKFQRQGRQGNRCIP